MALGMLPQPPVRKRNEFSGGRGSHLTEPLLRVALEAARAIEDEWYRSQSLAELAPHLTEPLLHEALEAARAIADERYRSQALAALAPHLTEPLLHEALEAARAIGNEWIRSQALAALAPRLEELGHPAKALEAARAIEGEWSRSQALAALVPHLGPTERDRALGEALEAARAIGDEEVRSRALAALAAQLAELTPATLSPLWSRTLRLLATHTRRDLLMDLIALVPVLAALGGAEAVAKAFRDPRRRAVVALTGGWWLEDWKKKAFSTPMSSTRWRAIGGWPS